MMNFNYNLIYFTLQLFVRASLTAKRAVSTIHSTSKTSVSGQIQLEQIGNEVIIEGTVHGLSPGLHGFHVHQNGNLGNDCLDAGGHFNPFNAQHGAPEDAIRHVGDLGNILANNFGTAEIYITDPVISLLPASKSFIGKLAFVIHAGRDDLGLGGDDGSLTTGNAGARVGCGIIDILQDSQQPQKTSTFLAFIEPGSNSRINGQVQFTTDGDRVILEGDIRGLTAGLHGFHVHEKGDLGSECKNAGGHFNPFQSNHGAPDDAQRHVGDLGNVRADSTGRAHFTIADGLISLDPNSPTYIGHLAVVIHSSRDDLGRGGNSESLRTGNAGSRDGCGVIVEVVDSEDTRVDANNNVLKTSHSSNQRATYGEVELVSASKSGVRGVVMIFSHGSGVALAGKIINLSPGLHGFHIHQFGKLSDNCRDAGPHFNPFNVSHGGPGDSVRHVGDLGNIEADIHGVATFLLFDARASLHPTSKSYIGERAIVVHDDADDLGRGGDAGSLASGNAGQRVGCGFIRVKDRQYREDTFSSLPNFDNQKPSNFQPSTLAKFRPATGHQRITFPRNKREVHEDGAGESSLKSSKISKASVKIIPGTDKSVRGKATITRHSKGIIIKGSIQGLKPGLHGFHVHEKGDLSNKCQNAGGHFNPFRRDHGDRKDRYHRHVGDLGNIYANSHGVAKFEIFDHKGSLDPKSKAFVGKRALVVHADKDDLGRGGNEASLRTGNSGARVGCGIIEVEKSNEDQDFFKDLTF